MTSGGRTRQALLVLGLFSFTGHGAEAVEPDKSVGMAQALRGLGDVKEESLLAAIASLGKLADPAAIPALEALCDDRLRAAPDGRLLIKDEKSRTLRDALSGAPVDPVPAGLRDVDLNNDIRRQALPVLAQLKLASPDGKVRLAAAEELANRGSADATILIRKAVAAEKDRSIRDVLELALAKLDLQSPDVRVRLAALDFVRAKGNESFKGDLVRLSRVDGEPDPQVRLAAVRTLASIESKIRLLGTIGSLFHGLSLASVLLFAALGLAVTFGLMGVINMAHGEMLMIGAYTTYSIQVLFQRYAPGAFDWYLVLAVPAAFVVTGLTGVVLERTVIRFLYGRPLETLLATWGISLGLIQTVRLLFGAQNVAVANPSWLSGGVTVAHGLVLPYSRLAVLGFVLVVAVAVWALLQRTRLGLKVRAVTQNRSMAACLGISTKRVDMWMFGLGSGIAGLGGVALSQIGNVGPDLGQSYIVDSFMVVVLGGVGRLAGTVFAATGLGLLNKLIEPFSGAVMGKIAMLAVIIIFIQRRPQGIFAQRGRVEA